MDRGKVVPMAATPDNHHDARGAQRDTVRITVPPRTPDATAHRETVKLPRQRRAGGPGKGQHRAPLPLAAAVTTLWAALLSAAPVIAVVALAQLAEAPHASIENAFRSGLAGWLLAHGVQLGTGLGTIALSPLAITGLAAWRMARAGVHTARVLGGRQTRSVRVALSAGVADAIVYAILGALAAGIARGPGLAISPIRAALTLGSFGLAAATLGALWTTGALWTLLRRLPIGIRDGLRTGIVAASLVLATGAAIAGLAVALAGGAASETLGSYHTGVAGQAGITLLCLAYAPNIAVWGASYLLGPGFAVGAGTAVQINEVSVGALPALPVFAGLPTGPLPGAGGLLVGAPFAAGLAAGFLLVRRRLRESPRRAGWRPLLGAAALAAPTSAVLLGLAAWASSGPVGAGRLAALGPVPWQVAVFGGGIAGLGALVGAAATRGIAGRS
jgi:hypothetical protein